MTPQRCLRCDGSLFYDRYDEEWRCLLCARPVTFVVPLDLPEARLGHPGRQISDDVIDAILQYVARNPGRKTVVIAEGLKVSRRTMGLRLAKLQELGMLINEGGLGGTTDPYRWFLADVEEESA
jgi:hypothetical protein